MVGKDTEGLHTGLHLSCFFRNGTDSIAVDIYNVIVSEGEIDTRVSPIDMESLRYKSMSPSGDWNRDIFNASRFLHVVLQKSVTNIYSISWGCCISRRCIPPPRMLRRQRFSLRWRFFCPSSDSSHLTTRSLDDLDDLTGLPMLMESKDVLPSVAVN